jgi:hypothetical protein
MSSLRACCMADAYLGVTMNPPPEELARHICAFALRRELRFCKRKRLQLEAAAIASTNRFRSGPLIPAFTRGNRRLPRRCAPRNDETEDSSKINNLRAGFMERSAVLLRSRFAPHRNTNTTNKPKFAANSQSAVGNCARMTALRSSNSSSTAGTKLKLAASGVISVPQ